MRNLKFLQNDTLTQFQELIYKIYGPVDDRLFSLSDLISNTERFTMRALKGLRKRDKSKYKANLMIAFSWVMALANRLHISSEEILYKRFPYVCSYCAEKPCRCRKINPLKRTVGKIDLSLKPQSLKGFQAMIEEIYPPNSRTSYESAVHLAEEMGEVSEAVHTYLGWRTKKQFQKIEEEVADLITCLFSFANSTKIDFARELAQMYGANCHICHKAPCQCNFLYVSTFRS